MENQNEKIKQIAGPFGEVDVYYDSAPGLDMVSLSGSASITVTIPDTAKPGDTYTITTSGEYSTLDADCNPAAHTFKASKTITVIERTGAPEKRTEVEAPKATVKPTAEPTATPQAAPEPTESAEVAEAAPVSTIQILMQIVKTLLRVMTARG